MKLRTAALLAVLCFLSGAAGFVAYRLLEPASPATLAEVQPMPQFAGLDGGLHPLDEWRGKLVVLNFWATWCAPCVEEIPLLVEAQARHGARGLQVVGIAIDDAEPVRQFRQRFGIPYPLLIGGQSGFAALDALGDSAQALPYSVVVAPDGAIVLRQAGKLTEKQLQGLVAGHLVP